MSQYTKKVNKFTGYLQLVPSNIVMVFRAGVANEAALPASGNVIGDARITNDTHHIYVWDGSAWQDQGDIIDLNWSAIQNKPTSTTSQIDDAVSKKHTQGTDQGLDTGGANATTAAEVKDAVTKALTIVTVTELTDEGINAAIDSLGASGGLVLLPEGTYVIDAPIVIDYDKTILMGYGQHTILDASAWATPTGNIITVTGVDNCEIKNLKIIGANSGEAYATINAIDSQYLTIEDVIIEEANYDAILAGASGSAGTSDQLIINRVTINGANKDGIKFRGTNCKVTNSRIMNTDGIGIFVYYCINPEVTDNYFYTCYQIVKVEGTTGLNLINNTFSADTQVAHDASQIYYWSNNTGGIIANNCLSINQNNKKSLHLRGLNKAIIANNYIKSGNFTSYNIYMDLYCTDNLIVNNMLEASTYNPDITGVYGHADADGNVLINNQFRGTFVNEYDINGTCTVIKPEDIADAISKKHDGTTQLSQNGINGTFTTTDGKTVTVVDGQITNIV